MKSTLIYRLKVRKNHVVCLYTLMTIYLLGTVALRAQTVPDYFIDRMISKSVTWKCIQNIPISELYSPFRTTAMMDVPRLGYTTLTEPVQLDPKKKANVPDWLRQQYSEAKKVEYYLQFISANTLKIWKNDEKPQQLSYKLVPGIDDPRMETSDGAIYEVRFLLDDKKEVMRLRRVKAPKGEQTGFLTDIKYTH